jgi:hypothetical protein
MVLAQKELFPLLAEDGWPRLREPDGQNEAKGHNQHRRRPARRPSGPCQLLRGVRSQLHNGQGGKRSNCRRKRQPEEGLRKVQARYFDSGLFDLLPTILGCSMVGAKSLLRSKPPCQSGAAPDSTKQSEIGQRVRGTPSLWKRDNRLFSPISLEP